MGGYNGITVGLLVDHAKAIRIPLLIILFAVVLTYWIDQIWELFALLVLPNCGFLVRWGTLTLSAGLGFAVWHTARTVYRFDIPTVPTLSDPRAAGVREWVPRVLGATIPLLMAVGTASALHDPAFRTAGVWWSSASPAAFGLEAILLFTFFTVRRKVFTGFAELHRTPAEDRRVTRWSQLPSAVRIVYAALMLANFLALILAAKAPGLLSHVGTLGVVLLCAMFLTITGTYLTIQAARWQFPLLTALFILTVLWQMLGWNDNHRVRLYPAMHSYSSPVLSAVHATVPGQPSLKEYVQSWKTGYSNASPVYLVSAEGGGIRAAAWTALVLSQLEIKSHGEFSKHMLLGSGVSGGSLGLAWFAAIVAGERKGIIQVDDIQSLVLKVATTDYLGPTVETMFLTDFLQRFWFRPAFVDRGERLETGWETAWTDACNHRHSATTAHAVTPTEASVCTQFSQPWTELWNSTERVPLLFLNSTEVASGQRFIQEPFAFLLGPGQDDSIVNAATWSTNLLPASSPLSSVVHNSARFTYVSPAGSLMDAATLKPGHSPTRQLVDGGYFENSGTTTTAELLALLAPLYDKACSGPGGLGDSSCPIKVIHISNDPGVESLRSDDACLKPASPYSHDGEIRAPLLALANTRDARGVAARAALRRLFEQGKIAKSPWDPYTDASVFHFRLCRGDSPLPLGWILAEESMHEMQRQMDQLQDKSHTGSNSRQLATIVTSVTASPGS